MTTDARCEIEDTWIHQRLAHYYPNSCDGGPPVCEFGGLGPEAEYWGTNHVWGGVLVMCQRCETLQDLDRQVETWCQCGDGGVYGMCGHRPYTAEELRQTYVRGDSMGPRPEVDRVNVVPCDGTLTGDAILFGPIDIARRAIRDAGGDPDDISRSDGAMLQYTITGRRYRRSVPKLQNLPPPAELPPHSELLGSSAALERAARSGESAAVCELLGRHEFGGDTCRRCGLIRVMIGRPRKLGGAKVTKIIVDDMAPRTRRGPVATDDSDDSPFERARAITLEMMGVSSDSQRKRS